MRSASDPRAFVLDTGPGTNRVAPRSRPVSSAPEISLDGEWRFRLAAGLADLTPGFERPAFDDAGWDTIDLPSCWQMVGRPDAPRYGSPACTNIRYPFPVDPPAVPEDNPTGEYRTAFALPAEFAAEGRVFLRFDGVDSAFTLWCNGGWVGDSKRSRVPSEFDPTPFLRDGTNHLAVRVHQWSAGSYLEDQDMWWVWHLQPGHVAAPARGRHRRRLRPRRLRPPHGHRNAACRRARRRDAVVSRAGPRRGRCGRVTNRQSFAGTAHVAYPWMITDDGVVVAAGRLEVPPLAPGATTSVHVPEIEEHRASGARIERWIRVEAVDVVDAGLTVTFRIP